MSRTAAPAPAAAGRIDGPTAARLAVLAGAAFVYVTFEVFPVGLITEIAADLDVTAGQVGLLISGYAVVAAVVTVPTVALAARVSRGTALMVSLGVLVVAEVLAAASTGFAMMAVSRVAAALTHGVLWSLIAPAAATLVPREHVGTATAAVFGGASLAAIVGSPGTTLIGGLIGWRATALVLAAATVAVTYALTWALRPQRTGSAGTEDAPAVPALAEEGRVDWPAVLALCGVAVVLVTAHFLSYTYFALIVTEVTGASGAVVVLLAAFGVAGAAGTYLIGRHNDRAPQRAATVTMAAFAAGVGLLALAFVPAPRAVQYAVVGAAVAVWGGAFAAAGPVFQTAVMRLAARDADRASSVYVTGFQIGIAGGSALGAALLGRSAAWLPTVSLALGAVVLAVVLVRRPVPALS
ncbi:MFS transporter [Streptomyces sp. NBC_01006]|uniref:MFS transporter n=1 Tax=Streptomyces sp. NBC_01006 TaxID=2903716 RepID=UPI00386F4C29|nr:MFS transporter [Streptomyces sp. NBC_01006]